MDGVIAYILSKNYTKNTVIGMGAIKGAPCQVQDITKVDKTTTVTLKWEDNDENVHTQSFDIEDGEDGVSVVGATIKPNGHLELTLSNGNSIDCGNVLPQYDTMPTPSSSNVGQILQYIGTTTSNYTNGYFYECINDGGVYKWVEKSVQDSYTKIEIGDLTQLPDNTKDVVGNIVGIKLSVDQLKGSILDKEDRFRYSTMPIADNTNVGKIVEYIGNTTDTYTNGYFYQCKFDGTNYSWVQKNVQPNNGGSGNDNVIDGYYKSDNHLFYEDVSYENPITGENNTLYVSLDTNLLYRYNGLIFIRVDESSSGEDDVINGYYNSVDGKFYEESTYTTEITGETGKIYISIDTNIQYRWDNISVPNKFVTISSSIAVDNELSTTSENPVQNKVITLALEQLQGSLINKVDKEVGKGLSSNDYTNTDKEKVIKLAPIYLIGSGLNLDESTGRLTASGIDVPIDDQLSDTSPNPVQNQVITLAIEQLQGSVLGKIRKRLSANANDFAIWDSQGEVIDSNISKDIIPSSASVNNKVLVKSDIDNALSDSSENPVQNKVITVPLQALQGSMANKANKVNDATADDFVVLNASGDLVDSGINKNIVPNDASSSNQLATKGDIKTYTGDNGVDIDANNKITLNISYLTASRVGYVPSTEKGANNGVATLDSAGKVPSAQLPSYVDDIVEGYKDGANFYSDLAHTQLITPENGKIYVDLTTNTTWRWGGTAYVQVSESLALGETATTAYRGDRGKTAYDHSQITSGNPHNVTATDVGLGNVANTGDSDTPISGGTTKFTTGGAYTELNKKADKVGSATNGHLAKLDGNGNLADSGKSLSDLQEKLTEGDGIDIANNVVSIEEMPSTDMSEIVTPTPTPIVPYMGNPTGCIIQMMGVNAPDGYLKCDGQVYNIADYQNLADYFNAQFNSPNYFGGNGTTTFAVPDLRGEFLRGTGTNSHTGQGSGSNVGTHQNATEIPYYYLNLNADGTNVQLSGRVDPAATGDFNLPNNTDNSKKSATPVKYGAYSSNQSTSPTAKEYSYMTRPTNTSVLYCIKY